MPTFEFFGYDSTQTDDLIITVKQRLADKPFREDIVFVTRSGSSQVTGWTGNSQPFIRILTRSAEKAAEMRESISDLSDVETLMIDFHKKGEI